MKKEELSEQIGKIDEDIIEETDKVRLANADKIPKRKKPLLIATSLFVAAAAAVTGVVVIPRVIGDHSIGTSEVTTTTAVIAEPGTTKVAALDGESDPKAGFSRERQKSDIVSSVEPVATFGDSIASDSGFSIKLSRDISENELRSRIRLSPQSEFTLTRDSDSSYLLKASGSFAKGSLVKLAVEDSDGEICDSWAFRTADDFAVASTYPSDNSSGGYVSGDSGIEIKFTSAPSDSDPSGYFSITPSTKGAFKIANNTLYFIPEDGLMPGTTYTVTVKKGFASEDGETLKDDCSFRFRTSTYTERGNYIFTSGSSSGFSETFPPGDSACVEIHCSDELRNIPFETGLYRFSDNGAYLDALRAKADESFDFAALASGAVTEVFRSTEKPFTRETDKAVYVILPDDLEPGCYVAEIHAGAEGEPGYDLDYFVQVSDISVYSLNLGDENVFFVNDSSDGVPAKGAEITVSEAGADAVTGTVGDDGLAYIKTGGKYAFATLEIKYGTKRYTDCIMLSGAENVKYDDLYYTYLYTDREAYLPDDTVNVWGVVIPKVRGTALPDDLKLTFGSVEQPVSPDADGTFKAKFTFTKHLETWSEAVRLTSGGDTLCTHYVSVRDYEKPTYILDIDLPDYAVMPQINPVPVKVTATYYEGTPAEGLMLRNESSGISDPDTLRTDSAGEAAANVTLDDREYSGVLSSWVAYNLTGVENTYTYADADLRAIYRDTILEKEYDDDSRTLTLRTYALDLGSKEKLDKFFADYDNGNTDYDIIKKGPADTAIHIEITRTWNEKTETGSHYDYIEKRTVKDYEYEYRREVVYSSTVNTVNGAAVLADLPTDPKLGRYIVDIEYYDSLGQKICESIYSLGRNAYDDYVAVYDDFGEPMFYGTTAGNILFRLDVATKKEMSEYNSYYNSFSENEEIGFELKCSGSEYKTGGKLLIAVYQSDFISYKIYDTAAAKTFLYKATADCIPNAVFTGAYFDGKHIYNVYGGSIIYDPTERGIALDVMTGRETYDAGDTAEITVTAKDMSGATLSGATVLLSLVDEAAFAIEDQDADPLSWIYRSVYYPRASSYVSYIQHRGTNGGGGEKGGGGPASVRKDFRDTAYFMSAVTDADGTATFTAELPDNMTTWRATVLAVYQKQGGEVLSGDTKQPVVVTRPLFITPIMHSGFVEGDDVCFSAKCAGLPADGIISVALTGNGINETRQIKQQQTASFGKLAKGDYTVTFTAEYNGDRDAVEMPVTVTDTLLETGIYKGADLSALADTVKPTKWPIYLALFNKEYMLSTDILYDLLRYGGDSLDSRIAASFAAKELGFITDEDFVSEYSNETAEGYAKLLPAAEGDAYLTALIAAAAPETVSPAAKTAFRDSIENGTLQDASIALMGLAALGEPVQNDVKKLESKIVYVPSGIYLSAALALCGDYDAAYNMYIKYVPDVVFNDSDPNAVTAYVPGNDGNADQLRTKSALITASLLDLPEAEYFARYLLGSKPEYSSYALELALYVSNFTPKSKTSASFSYTLNGKTETVTPDKHHPTLMELTEEQFNSANFTVTSGDIYVIADYIGRIGENVTPPTMTVTKRLSGDMTVGGEITVTIQSEPYCAVYDVIPSCGRLTGSQSGQLVRLFTDRQGRASYTFTVSTEGSYVLESPAAYDYPNGRWGIGERSVIKIGSGNETM